MKAIQKYVTEPCLPWQRGPFIGGAGLFACGWTAESKVFMLFPDSLIIGNPISGEREIVIESNDLLSRLSKDNLTFELTELNEVIKVFGLRGGNGNHFTTDRWSLIEIQQDSQEKIFGLADPKSSKQREKEFWRNYTLLKLNHLEFGQWCGFAPNEKSLGIFGLGGVELFNR